VASALDAAERRALYLLVARLLAEEIDAPLYRRLLAEQGDALSWIEPEIAEIGEEAALETLHTEYFRLFLGPHPRCPPFASVARGEALLGGRARTRVDDLLASFGLVIDASARIASPDHVAVVFAVLAELSDPEAIDVWLRDVVMPWVPDWLHALELASDRVLFRTIARVAITLLEEEPRSHVQSTP
jgi:TorA maturation chaperone TorD